MAVYGHKMESCRAYKGRYSFLSILWYNSIYTGTVCTLCSTTILEGISMIKLLRPVEVTPQTNNRRLVLCTDHIFALSGRWNIPALSALCDWVPGNDSVAMVMAPFRSSDLLSQTTPKVFDGLPIKQVVFHTAKHRRLLPAILGDFVAAETIVQVNETGATLHVMTEHYICSVIDRTWIQYLDDLVAFGERHGRTKRRSLTRDMERHFDDIVVASYNYGRASDKPVPVFNVQGFTASRIG